MTPVLGSRALFPDLTVPHYLNTASISPLSRPATEAMTTALMRQAQGGIAAIETYAAAVDACRSAFSRLVGGTADDVAVIPNTSAGISAIALTLDWRPGDRVLVFRGDFPANITPWQQAAARHDLTLVWLDGDRFRTDRDGILDDVRAELTRGLRLIAVSAVSFTTGLWRPVERLAEMCKNTDTELFVDAIQAAGVVPVRMDWGIDYLACGGHKWLGGPFGIGLLAVAPHRWAQLGGHLASWMSHEDPLTFLFGEPGHLRYDKALQAGPALFEGGAFNGIGAAGLAASLGVLNTLGIDPIRAHVDGLNTRLSEGLSELGLKTLRTEDAQRRAGSVVVQLDTPVGPVVQALAERGVSVASPDGRLRIAPHWYANTDDIDAALSALRDVRATR